MSLKRLRTYMRLICLMAFMLLILAAHAKEEDEDEVTFNDFTLYTGDRIEIGDYRADLIEIQSVRDGLVVMSISKAGGSLDEQRALLQNNANNFDGGAEEGGLTLTVEDIFDDQSAKIRVEYMERLGTARKRTSERPRTSGDLPNLVVTKSFDRDILGVGDDAQVTVAVKNVGTGTAEGIVVEDLPPLSGFTYIAGYPPKIKDKLEPGESDSAVYVIKAVEDGSIRVPAIAVRYQDSKENAKSNTSEPFAISITPKSKPNLELSLIPSGPISEGNKGALNVSVANAGKASATKVEIKAEIEPSDGLETSGLEKTYFEIAPGGEEIYSAEMTGDKAGNYTVILKASFLGGEETMFSEGKADVVVLEREYKYLYYLLLLPAVLVAAWIYKRYREYKY
ncbi:MAG TPA: hypothetical protein VLB04_11160 [Methanotrichaceae archaeon]|nr:hypothetical protein [Methanotrichaceae archaeon]